MRNFLLGAALWVGLCPGSRAQELVVVNSRSFPEAALVLTTGVLLKGTLRLYPEAELVSLTCANDSTYSLPAGLVQGFAVKDPLLAQLPTPDTYLSAERVFRTLPLATKERPGLPGWGFYEQLSAGSGPVLLLRREQILPVQLDVPDYRAAGADSIHLLVLKQRSYVYHTTLYLRTATGSLVELAKPRHVLKYLPHQAPLLRAYARENGLHYTNLRDLSFLVNYVNTLPPTTP